MTIAAFLLAVALGIDVFAGGLSLGVSGANRRQWPRIALMFAAIAFFMTALGVLFGRPLGDELGSHASYIAGSVLLVVGLRAFADAWLGEHDDQEVISVLGPWTVLSTGIMVCIDKLAIGFSMAFVDISVAGAIGAIVVISFLATILGLYLGQRLGAHGEHVAEYVAGVLFIVLGIAVIWQTASGDTWL